MVDVQNDPVPALIALDIERPQAVVTHVFQRHRLDCFMRAGHGRVSFPTLDLVPCHFEGLHDCFRLSDSEEGVNASSTLADVLHDGISDHGSNRCLFSTNGHEAPHNDVKVYHPSKVLPP
jgi:hypothetical protein